MKSFIFTVVVCLSNGIYWLQLLLWQEVVFCVDGFAFAQCGLTLVHWPSNRGSIAADAAVAIYSRRIFAHTRFIVSLRCESSIF